MLELEEMRAHKKLLKTKNKAQEILKLKHRNFEKQRKKNEVNFTLLHFQFCKLAYNKREKILMQKMRNQHFKNELRENTIYNKNLLKLKIKNDALEVKRQIEV